MSGRGCHLQSLPINLFRGMTICTSTTITGANCRWEEVTSGEISLPAQSLFAEKSPARHLPSPALLSQKQTEESLEKPNRAIFGLTLSIQHPTHFISSG